MHYVLTPRTSGRARRGRPADLHARRASRAARPVDRAVALDPRGPPPRAHPACTSRLRFLGFGSVQDGTWLAPHDRERELAALLAELDVAEYAGVLLGRPVRPPSTSARSSRGCGTSTSSPSGTGRSSSTSATARRPTTARRLLLRTRLVHTFREFPFLDPELPEDLVPAPAAPGGGPATVPLPLPGAAPARPSATSTR